ncbi:MAG: cytochrome b [Proteobacteria bacterium]|nr:cytochrome b [Pseudomonadota bacterium]
MNRVDGGTIPAATPAAQGYGAAAKGLHWLVVLLVLVEYIVAILMPDIGPRTQPGPLIDLHFSFGVVIVLVMAVRLFARLAAPVALDMPDAPAWERRSASLTHVLFYVLLIVAPFLGWASASAHSLPVSVFGLVPLPAIAAPRARWALVAGDIHKVAMWATLALIGLHALAALYHHFVRHDRVLLRMLPERRQGSSAKRERTLCERSAAPGSGGDAATREFDREGRGSGVP